MPGDIKNVMAAIDYSESHLHENWTWKQLRGLCIIQNTICTGCSQVRQG